MKTNTRFESLQGLRGIAALTVAISHFLGAFYISGADTGTIVEAIRPISHLFGILAVKAVWVFFVLSGFVLTHQLMSQPHNYWRYLVSRLARLYFPVWVAVTMSFLVITYLHFAGVEIDFWIGSSPQTLEPILVVQEYLLIPDWYFLGPLWSLKWEVVFSLLAYSAWKARFYEKHPVITILLALGVATLGQAMLNGWLTYLPMFLIGVVIRKVLHEKPGFVLNKFWELTGLVVAAALPVGVYLVTFTNPVLKELSYIVDVPVSLGSIVALFAILLRAKMLKRLLETRVLNFLGKISFSLYLFHVPIILLFVYVSGFDLLWGFIGFLIAFPISYLGYTWVERPVQNFSRKLRTPV